MRRKFLAGTDLEVSSFGLGTGEYGIKLNENVAHRQMDIYTDVGGNLFDTARVYGPEQSSEIIIGRWLKHHGNRDKLILSTKGGHPPLENMSISRLSASDIQFDLNASLKNLATDYIDIYFLHRDDPTIPVFEILSVLENEVKKGNIRYYGCSNWTLSRVREAEQCAKREGFMGFVCNQIKWSLADTNMFAMPDETLLSMDSDFLRYHENTKLSVMAYASTASGYFIKRVTGMPLSAEQHALYDNETNEIILKRLIDISEESGISVGVLSLLYFYRQSFPAIPLCSFSREEQMRDALDLLTQNYPTDIMVEFDELKRFVY